MNDKHIVSEIQDLARAVDETTRAVKSLPAPQVQVAAPQVQVDVAAPEVKVALPEMVVHNNIPIPAAAPPVVNVAGARVSIHPDIYVKQTAAPNAYRVTVTRRDPEGFIEEFLIVPIG